MVIKRGFLKNRNTAAWILLIAALTFHVFDEVVTDFLPFYNQFVLQARENLGILPMPTFSFGLWLAGLIVALAAGAALTVVVHRGGRVIRWVTTAVGVIMILNACAHMLGSIYAGRLLPGFWSSPFLLLAALYVTVVGLRSPTPVTNTAKEPG
jgi:hypothetical protein